MTPTSPAPSARPVVVGLDGSDCARAAFATALAEARLRSTRLVVVHGWLVTQPGLPLGVPARLDEATEARLAEVLHEQVDVLRADAGDVEVDERLGYGYAGNVLVEASEGAELVVVGRRGLGAVRSALLGSVSHHVVEHASCPVLVVHAAGDVPVGKVVAGVDGSPTSLEALRWADDRARRDDLPLTAVHAVTATGSGLDPADPAPPPVEDLRAALLGWVQDAVGTSRAAQVDLVVEHRHPAHALHDLSAPDTLVVVGRRGTGGFLALGSVARRTSSHALGPVVVVPPAG